MFFFSLKDDALHQCCTQNIQFRPQIALNKRGGNKYFSLSNKQCGALRRCARENPFKLMIIFSFQTLLITESVLKQDKRQNPLKIRNFSGDLTINPTTRIPNSSSMAISALVRFLGDFLFKFLMQR